MENEIRRDKDDEVISDSTSPMNILTSVFIDLNFRLNG